MFKLSSIIVRSSKTSNRLAAFVRFNNLTTPTNVEVKPAQFDVDEDLIKSPNVVRPVTKIRTQNNMIAAAFASLHAENAPVDIKTPFTDDKIQKATSVDELLSISEGSGVSRRHALKVVSVLADWTTKGTIKLADFETDSRFIRLCKILTKGTAPQKNRNNSAANRSEDLSTILSVTADDEAAKLVASITLPQMVKVMSTLSQKKRRSTLLLRALAYNITASSERLDLKQSADLLYSMSTLNFSDENLLARVTNDVCAELEGAVKGSAVIGSIITSVGLLRYKNPEILDALSDWLLKSHATCRPQDIFSLFMTLAVLNYFPSNSEKLFEVLIPQLTLSDAGKPQEWLEIVWSLALLSQVTAEHISSVLSEDFLNKLEENGTVGVSMKLKLLNIDATAQYLVKSYNGPRLSATSSVRSIKIGRSKEKIEMAGALVDSLKNLIQSENCIRTGVDTGLGFYIDAECLLGRKCNPLPLDQKDAKVAGIRVAMLALDYHDMCREKIEPTGVNVLAKNLLEAQGYKVLLVPYTEFKHRDKVVFRVQYLESKLKELLV